MRELPLPIAKRDAQEDPADQREEEEDRHGEPECGHPLLQELPAVGGLTYSRAHKPSSGPL